jgi:hypothetical protein
MLQQEVGALRWIDNAPVTILTTAHELACKINRERKRPGKKSTNAKKAREAFGEEQTKEMPIPTCFDDYKVRRCKRYSKKKKKKKKKKKPMVQSPGCGGKKKAQSKK